MALSGNWSQRTCEIIDLHETTLTIAEIATLVGCCESRVRHVWARARKIGALTYRNTKQTEKKLHRNKVLDHYAVQAGMTKRDLKELLVDRLVERDMIAPLIADLTQAKQGRFNLGGHNARQRKAQASDPRPAGRARPIRPRNGCRVETVRDARQNVAGSA